MIRSMTGYAQAQQIVGGKDILVEIKSVNHRFFDFSFRSSRMFSFLEGDFQKYMQAAISRGKVDVSVTIDILEDDQIEIRLNEDLLRGYVGALKSIAAKYELPDDVSVGTLTRFSDIFNVKRQQLDTDEIWQCVRQVADQALAGFLAMREQEGKKLSEDLAHSLQVILAHVDHIELASERIVADYRTRLESKIKEVLADKTMDESRVLTEVAIFADRMCVAEEIVRIRSHALQFEQFLHADEPVGRKMNFLVQELNREVNTIGSKISDMDISTRVVEMKAELEKIREQIQNVE